MPRHFHRNGRLLLAALPLVLAAPGCSEPSQLEVGLIGCSEVLRGPVCRISKQEREIRLFVRTLSGAEITVAGRSGPLLSICDGGRDLQERCVAAADGNQVRVQLDREHTSLRVTVRMARSLGSRSFDIALEPPVPDAPWVAEAAQLRNDAEQPRSAEDIILRNLARPELSRVELAQAYSELAQDRQEQLRLNEAELAIQDAVRLDDEAGLLSRQSFDLFVWADLLQDQRRLLKLEQILDTNQALFSTVAEDRPWLALYRAQAQQRMGSLDLALRYLDEADRANRTCGDDKSIHMASVLRAGVLADLGRISEDVMIKLAAEQLKQYPCRLGLLLRRQALLRIQALEYELGEGVPVDRSVDQRLRQLWTRLEPGRAVVPGEALRQHDAAIQKLLDRSLRAFDGISEDGVQGKPCHILRHIALVMLAQIRLALLTGRAESAQIMFASLREKLSSAQVKPEEAPVFGVEWLHLQARLLRAQGRFEEALALINQLEKYTGDDVGAFEVQWMLQMGRAQALLQLGEDHRDKLLDALWSADAIVEDASRSAPQLFGRGPLLGRFEWGSRLLLEQLLRVDAEGGVHATQAERNLALRYMRHVRTRGLLELRRLDRLQSLDANQQRSWREAVSSYIAARQALEHVQAQASTKEQLQAAEDRARQKLVSALTILGEEAAPEQRRPQPGELMLICHPLRQRWACVLAEPGEGASKVVAATIRMDDLPETSESWRLGERILGAFRQQLLRKDARTLTVFGYGVARDIPLHHIPLDGKPLGERLAVRYSLDLGLTAPVLASQLALFAVDGKLKLPAAPFGKTALADFIMRPIVQSRTWGRSLFELGRNGNVVGRGSGAASLDVREKIGDAGLLVLFGHADYVPANGWISGIAWTPWSRLTAGDVLVLPVVPPRVLLIACSSGSTLDALGGQESLGLAQAFLLRGSQEVLGTTRAVSAEAGAVLVQRILQHLAERPQDSLVSALQAALASLYWTPDGERLEVGHDGDQAEWLLRQRIQPDLDAFRIFTR